MCRLEPHVHTLGPTEQAQQRGAEGGVQDLVVGRHLVALEERVLEGGGEAVEEQVGAHEQQAKHTGIGGKEDISH